MVETAKCKNQTTTIEKNKKNFKNNKMSNAQKWSKNFVMRIGNE